MSTWLDEQPPEQVARQVAALAAASPMRVANAGGDARFALWLYLVDRRVVRAVGVGLNDLQDWNTRDAYEAGMSPREGMIEALRNDDLYEHLVGQAEAGML